jgi:hypothetical protein
MVEVTIFHFIYFILHFYFYLHVYTLFDFKLYYRAILKKQYGIGTKIAMNANGTEGPE